MSKKIAIYQYDLDVGGIQKSLINLIKHLDGKYEIDLFLFSKKNFYNEKFSDKVNVHYLKPFPSFFKVIPFNLIYFFTKYKSKKQYDVSIDFNSYQMETAIYSLKTKAYKKIIWCHNDVAIKLKEEKKYRILWFFFNKKFYQFDQVCAVSNGVKESFCKVTGINEKEVLVLPNYIDTCEIIKKSEETPDLEINKDSYNLVTVGRVTHQKGLDILLPIYKEVLKQRKDIHLYIIGDGEELQNIQLLAEKLNINDYISFLGRKSNPFSYLKIMDGFVLTSRYEGQGMVILEAKCLGLDLFFSKHLEKYLPKYEGQEDICATLVKAKKKPQKSIDMLDDYNQNILSTFDSLCDKEVK